MQAPTDDEETGEEQKQPPWWVTTFLPEPVMQGIHQWISPQANPWPGYNSQMGIHFIHPTHTSHSSIPCLMCFWAVVWRCSSRYLASHHPCVAHLRLITPPQPPAKPLSRPHIGTVPHPHLSFLNPLANVLLGSGMEESIPVPQLTSPSFSRSEEDHPIPTGCQALEHVIHGKVVSPLHQPCLLSLQPQPNSHFSSGTEAFNRIYHSTKVITE